MMKKTGFIHISGTSGEQIYFCAKGQGQPQLRLFYGRRNRLVMNVMAMTTININLTYCCFMLVAN
jgi:hypothetical protein